MENGEIDQIERYEGKSIENVIGFDWKIFDWIFNFSYSLKYRLVV